MRALTASATAPEWITAGFTAVLGVFAAAFGVWQFAMEGFRPNVRAKIDVTRTRILVEIQNRSRGSGMIARLVLIDSQGLAISPSAPVSGYPFEVFVPTALPAHTGMRLMVQRPGGLATFPDGIRVKVDWGTGSVIREPLQTDVGYGGLTSVLPPA